MRVLSATVSRRSRTGDIIGPRHRVPVGTALKAMTIWAAHQHFEEGSKGSIEVGKLADFVALSGNPMTADPERLAGLKVDTSRNPDVRGRDGEAAVGRALRGGITESRC